jgi:hypothetical protein
VPPPPGLGDAEGRSVGWRLRTGEGDGARDLAGDGVGSGDALGPGTLVGLAGGVARAVEDGLGAGELDAAGPEPEPEPAGPVAGSAVRPGEPGAGVPDACAGRLADGITAGGVEAAGASAVGRTGSNPYRMTTGIDATITSEVMMATIAIERPSRTRRLMRSPAAPRSWQHARRCRACPRCQ